MRTNQIVVFINSGFNLRDGKNAKNEFGRTAECSLGFCSCPSVGIAQPVSDKLLPESGGLYLSGINELGPGVAHRV
jgi:hypothetical protein